MSGCDTQTSGLPDLANVVGVCSGRKIKGGVDTGRKAIVALVEKKSHLIKSSEAVPHSVNGIETDVIEVGEIKPLGGIGEYERPVADGDSIGRQDGGGAGTLGMYYYMNEKVFALTAGHAVMKGIEDNPIGREVTQPSGRSQIIEGKNRYRLGLVNSYESPFANNNTDVASILIDDVGGPVKRPDPGYNYPISVGLSNCKAMVTGIAGNKSYDVKDMFLINPSLYSTLIVAKGHMSVLAEDTNLIKWPVFIRGAVTLGTHAYVFSTDLTVRTRIFGQLITMTGLHAYLASNSGSTIVKPGDSGAIASVKNGKHAIGMVTMGSNGFAVGIPIMRQMRAVHPGAVTIGS